MLNAMEELMRLHPASHYGRQEHRPSDVEVFEELESRDFRPRQEYETDRREPTWTNPWTTRWKFARSPDRTRIGLKLP